MMYKILNRFFGWDYIHWRNSADQGIARVHMSMDGKVYYIRYKNTQIFDIIKDPSTVIWLTCKPGKYFK